MMNIDFVALLLRLLGQDRKSTRLNSSHQIISYAVFCLKKKNMECYRKHSSMTPRVYPLRRTPYPIVSTAHTRRAPTHNSTSQTPGHQPCSLSPRLLTTI